MVVSCPEGYEPNPEFLEDARRNCEASGSNVKLERNPRKAAADADIIYTDVIVSMGQETDREKKIKIFLPDYQVNSEIIKAAKDNVIFMHPLPCRRGEEVTGPVIDGPVSVVWDQAENRLHTTKAILSLIL
jgi:ornithine carbamoyltransferase